MLVILSVLLAFAASLAEAAFGYTSVSGGYQIDAGSSNALVFVVQSADCDITSILYRGVQLQDGTASQIGSGLGSAKVSVKQSGDTITVTCDAGTLTHYYIVRNGVSNIFMGTYITAEPSVGELRYIARLKSAVLPNNEPFGVVSTTAGSTSTVEGSDVFVVGGQTRSKFYSSERFIDDKRHCVAGTDTRACFILPDARSYETSSGGPFMRDINVNNVGAATHLTFYMNSNHAQTEAYRTGFFGPYVLTFSRSGTPDTNIDTTFFAGLGVRGYIANADRGSVSGTASGTDSKFETVIHWYNNNAQYWTKASGGKFTSPLMKPGTYTQVLYQGELKVAQNSVSVAKGATASTSIASTWKTGTSLFKIGDWDGAPWGFQNADKFLRQHPSDSRMTKWAPVTFTVGSSAANAFPMALFKAVNNPVTIKFNLASNQLGAATLRIGTTLAFAAGRPQAKVNSWTGPAPDAPNKVDSRGVTRGAYRGRGEVYDVAIPAGTLVSGANTITINVISGSSGDTFLSPNFIFDAVELFK
ncbi:ubiquinone biosynthesis monooxygenase COQ6 [Elsinoe australis]|uniref:Rhamnogalacturonate lyase n=1 Tax=Elsinoe australis TaxID=40998 RepID=A0A2P7ZY73_9PEZI|nr:ubiquinone biosynthesis monooxygenase COQ6 [Elsinoe australis]